MTAAILTVALVALVAAGIFVLGVISIVGAIADTHREDEDQ